jgi:dUTP pyrophosphatase
VNQLAAFTESCLGLPPVKFKRLTENAVLPSRGTAFSAGMDLYSNVTVCIPPGETFVVSTGVAIELPKGTEGQVRSRSGLAAKFGVHVLNAPGTIDEDYRGELKAILKNTGKGDFWVTAGDRIAQLVIAPVSYNPAIFVEELSPAPTRGDAGFGSTGR